MAALVAPAHTLDRLRERGWGSARVISKVTTPIFMGVVFFVVITPIAVVMRLFGRHPLVHSERNGSYWVTRATDVRNDMERQFLRL